MENIVPDVVETNARSTTLRVVRRFQVDVNVEDDALDEEKSPAVYCKLPANQYNVIDEDKVEMMSDNSFEVSTGAQNDLERITRMAYSQVSLYGMSESVGLVSFPSDNETFLKPYSDETAQMIDKEARELIETCYNRTLEMVTTRKDLVTELAEELLKKEVLNLDDLNKILGERPFKSAEIRNIDKYQGRTDPEPEELADLHPVPAL